MKIIHENGDISREFYVFLRYNQVRNDIKENLSEQDENIYQEFNKQFKEFKTLLENGDSKASSKLGNIMNLFGFNRHYCAISGLPIIGKYKKINGKVVSQDSYDSWQIVQEMQKVEENITSNNTLSIKSNKGGR